MLEIARLCAGYPGKEVLHHVQASLPCGKLTVVLGPNGCGKSTLLKALCGLIPTTEGRVLLKGECLTGLPPGQLARKMAYLAQGRPLPDITVRRLVLHGRFPYLSYPRKYRPEDEAIARNAMEEMGLLPLADEPLARLSGGQRQKAYIAMALAQQTPVILLDEPTTYLDIRHQFQLMQQARSLAAQGKTVVMVLHDLPHALEYGDQVILMDQGNLVLQGTPDELFSSRELDRVFGIRVNRFQTKQGSQYYCEEM